MRHRLSECEEPADRQSDDQGDCGEPKKRRGNCRSQITSTNLPTVRRVGRYGPWPQPGFLCRPREPLGCGVRSVIVTRHRRLTRAHTADSRYEGGTPAHGNAFFGRALCRFESDWGHRVWPGQRRCAVVRSVGRAVRGREKDAGGRAQNLHESASLEQAVL